MRQIICPEIDPELIEYLESVFPDKCVDPSKEDPAVAFGQASVVRHLKAVAESQKEEPYVRIR